MFPVKDNIPNDQFPIVTVALFVANVVVYVLVSLHGGSLISGPDAHELAKYGATPHSLTVRTVLTSMFVNESIFQLAGNMLFLWIFGNTIEDSMGPLRFLCFYVAAGLAALALQVALDPGSTAPTAGPAGAIAAIIGGYVVLYPRARVLTLVLIIFFFGVLEVPVWAMVGLWFVMQAVFANGTAAYIAHLGSFVLGALAIRLLATRRKATPPTAAAYR
jgi:membrane associated rhomboid family serine protease